MCVWGEGGIRHSVATYARGQARRGGNWTRSSRNGLGLKVGEEPRLDITADLDDVGPELRRHFFSPAHTHGAEVVGVANLEVVSPLAGTKWPRNMWQPLRRHPVQHYTKDVMMFSELRQQLVTPS